MSRPALTRLGQAAIAATALLAPVAGTAHAASYDQISRASGATGTSPGSPYFAQPVFASDTGRYAAYTDNAYGDLDPDHADPEPQVRDVVANRTAPLDTGKRVKLLAVDAAEKTELIERFAADYTGQFVVRPVLGGPERVVAAYPGDGTTATLSGDGRWVAVSGPSTGTREINVATGQVKQLGDQVLRLGLNSISDDGSVVAGTYGSIDGGYFRAGAFTAVPDPAVVSPNGSTVAWGTRGTYPDPDTVVSRNLAAGKDVTTTLGLADPSIIQWISVDGSKVVLGSTEGDGAFDNHALAVDTATGATSVFGGPYTGYLAGEALTADGIPPFSVISRNGRFAAIRFGNQAALVDLTGRTLPGGGDPLTLSTYLRTFSLRNCSNPSMSFATVSLMRPATWAPKPTAAILGMAFDGKTVKTGLVTQTSRPGDGPTPESSLIVPELPQTVKTITYSALIADGAGHVVSGRLTQPPTSTC